MTACLDMTHVYSSSVRVLGDTYIAYMLVLVVQVPSCRLCNESTVSYVICLYLLQKGN